MVNVVTINRPDVVAHIEALANRLTRGNKTEVVALALRNLDERNTRRGSLFGAHLGSVTVREGVDLTAPILERPTGGRTRRAAMTDTLLLDTHVVLWLDTGDSKLRVGTRDIIDRLWLAGGSVLVSAVSAWEIALLADTGRISLDCPPEAWIERFLGRPGVAAVPLTCRASTRAYQLPHFVRRDPADRLLVATAIDLECEFVTYDGPITDYAVGPGRQTGLRVVN